MGTSAGNKQQDVGDDCLQHLDRLDPDNCSDSSESSEESETGSMLSCASFEVESEPPLKCQILGPFSNEACIRVGHFLRRSWLSKCSPAGYKKLMVSALDFFHRKCKMEGL